MVKGVGYITIFQSDTQKFELSVRGTSLRKTFCKDNTVKEHLYVKIDDLNEIHKIEALKNTWITYDGDGYIVRGLLNDAGRLSGYYKVVESSKVKIKRRSVTGGIEAIDSGIGDWTYYKRRIVSQ